MVNKEYPACVGSKIRGKGMGRGLGYGKGEGPMGRQREDFEEETDSESLKTFGLRREPQI